MPTQESSQQRLERAIASVLRARGEQALPAVLATSGTSLSPAGSWGVVEIVRYRGAFGRAGLREMARRHHLPAAVLEPTFEELAGQRMITREGDTLELTADGEREVGRVLAAFRGWLAEQLSDWEDGPDSAQIATALTDISRQLLAHHDEHRLPASPAPAA